VSGHHLIPRDHLAFRWSLKNLVPLCWLCHGAVHDGHLDLEDWLRITDEDRFWFVNTHANDAPESVKDWQIAEWYEILKKIKEVM
jgi:5-methylcytosine-specific restriction endonuclease McrA